MTAYLPRQALNKQLAKACDKLDTILSYFFKTLTKLILLAALAGCQNKLAADPWQTAGFTQAPIATASFTLYSARKFRRPGQDVIVYVEGDGHAWVTRSEPSTNPTPVDDLVRRLALQDDRANIVYLARPCQFIGMTQSPCAAEFWLEKRFSPEVLTSMGQALDQIKAAAQAQHLHLVGYSGGGAVAVLLAAQRTDIASLTTIAGNLDTALYTQLHHVSPMTESLNPLDAASALGALAQIHYVGGKDDNVPEAIVRSFVNALPVPNQAKIKLIPQATHSKGWENLHIDQ